MNMMNTESMDKAAQGMMQAYEEAGNMAREQMEATMKSAAAMSKGFDEIARNAGGLFQESLSRSVSAGKTIMGAKSVREMMDLQAEFLKDCFDCWVASTGKISEISARTAQQAFEPMAEHANHAMHKMSQKANNAA